MFLNVVWAFSIYFLTGATAMVSFTALYLRITEHDEIALMREGNVAAALALAGTMIGFAIPLARTITQSASLLDMLIWALVALAGSGCFPGCGRAGGARRIARYFV